MRSKLKKGYITVFIFIIIAIPIFTDFIQSDKKINEIDNKMTNDEFNREKRLKISSFWVLTNPIHVDNNWSATNSTYNWCSGTGSLNTPYIIENITINATGFENGIHIENSNDYFIIRNCTIYGANDAGIEVNYANYGTIINNNCTLNAFGIFTNSADYFKIIGNYASNNSYTGIDLEAFCDQYNISGNTVNYNNQEGIVLRQECTQINITNNIAIGNQGNGIQIQGDSYNNNIENNTVKNNNYNGIAVITGSYQNNFTNNTIYDNDFAGIRISESDNNTFINNSMRNDGIIFQGLFGTPFGEIAGNKIDITNTLNGNPIYFYANETNLNSVNFSYAGSPGQIILINCNNSLVSNSYLFNCTSGIALHYSNNNTIYNNSAYNNTHGIYLKYSNNNTLERNYGSLNKYGIYLERSNNNTIIDNNESNNIDSGIYLTFFCENNTISRNNASHNKYGIYLNAYCHNNTVSENNLTQNSAGIYLKSASGQYCEDNNILGNSMFECGIVIEVDMFTPSSSISSNKVDTANSVNGGTVYYYTDEIGLGQINFTNKGDPGQIFLINCNNSIISDFNLSQGSIGISLFYSSNNSLLNNHANNNTLYGIFLGNKCDNNTLLGNNINNNSKDGIYLSAYCSNNTISLNTANNNSENGIYLFAYCDNNTISDNTLNGNIILGLYLYWCLYNSISGNIIKNNENGITISSSDNTTLIGNIISSNNNIGILLKNCDYNLFYNNKFIQNGIHAVDNGTNNAWNTTSIGNYWDNYTGVDADFDCIGDTPYTFIYGSANSNDSMPIWDKRAPLITIQSPTQDAEYGKDAPSFTVIIADKYLDIMWYSLDGGMTNITFVGNAKISQSLWDALPDGKVTITFYANDTWGNITSEEVTINKNTQEEVEEPFPFIVILVLSICVIGGAGVGSTVVVKWRKSGAQVGKKARKTLPTKQVAKTEDSKPKKLKPSVKEPKPIKLKPKGGIKLGKAEVSKAPLISVAASELEEKQKTESEVGVEEQEFICVVHKGPILGDNYLCPHCKTFYCVKCAKALKGKGEDCWSCGNEINVVVPEEITPKAQKKIEELESKIVSLKITVQNLDENLYSGAISQEEYTTMRNSLTERISAIVKQIEELRI